MRLVTRGDLDGLACAVLISEKEAIDEIVLVHPQDITDRKVEIRSTDILANLPYHPDCGTWFDHHELTASNARPPADFKGRYEIAPSAAQLAWEFYGQESRWERLVAETNRLDSADLAVSDILDPQGFIMLGFTIDGRTGLGAFKDYFLHCIEWLKSKSIDEVLEEPEVRERIDRLVADDKAFRAALQEHSKILGSVIYTDFRSLESVPSGNRFLVYALYPESNISLRVAWGPRKEFVAATVGHSIFNRTSKVDVAQLLARYGGGGHAKAGATPLDNDKADACISEILEELQKD